MAAKNSNAVVVDATISPEADKEAPALGKIGKKPSVVQKMTKTLKKRTFSFFKTFCHFIDFERSLSDLKDVVDTLGVMAALLLYIPVEAIMRFDYDDWDHFHATMKVCHSDTDESDSNNYEHVTERYKEVCLLGTVFGLMILVGLCLFQLLVNDDTVKKYRREVNVFMLYMLILLGLEVVSVVVIFEIIFEWFSSDTSDVCDKAHGGFSHEQQEHAGALIVATLFPLSLFFGFWRLECFECFYTEEEFEDEDVEVEESGK